MEPHLYALLYYHVTSMSRAIQSHGVLVPVLVAGDPGGAPSLWPGIGNPLPIDRLLAMSSV